VTAEKEGMKGEEESTKNLFSACLVLLLLSLRQFRVFLCRP
jgi:hypothetical protein